MSVPPIAALPMPLRWLSPPARWSAPDGASLVIEAGSRTDWFVDPQDTGEPVVNAPALAGDPSGDRSPSPGSATASAGPRRG